MRMMEWGNSTFTILDRYDADGNVPATHLGGLSLYDILNTISENFSAIDHTHEAEYSAIDHTHTLFGNNVKVQHASNPMVEVLSTNTAQYGQVRIGQNTKYIIGYGPGHASYPDMIAVKTNTTNGNLGLFTGNNILALKIDKTQVADFTNNPTVDGDEIYHAGSPPTTDEIAEANAQGFKTFAAALHAGDGVAFEIPTNCGGLMIVNEDGANDRALVSFNNDAGTLGSSELVDTGNHLSTSGTDIIINNNHGGDATYYVTFIGRNVSSITVSQA